MKYRALPLRSNYKLEVERYYLSETFEIGKFDGNTVSNLGEIN